MRLDERKVLAILAENQMTMSSLCAQAEISRATLRRALYGMNRSTTVTIGKIARVLDVTVESIVRWED